MKIEKTVCSESWSKILTAGGTQQVTGLSMEGREGQYKEESMGEGDEIVGERWIEIE